MRIMPPKLLFRSSINGYLVNIIVQVYAPTSASTDDEIE